MLQPKNLTDYSFIIKVKVRRGWRSLSFLSHASIISSSSRLSRGVFLSLCGQARSANDHFLMCAENMSQGSLTYCTHWAGRRSHAAVVLSFGACLMLLLHGFVLSKPAWFCGYAQPLSWVIINLQGSPIFFCLQSPSGINYLTIYFVPFSSVQFSSVTQSCPTLCHPMNRNMPGLPIHHQLPEFTQTHVHRISDAIKPSHPLSSPSPPDPNPSQHQGLFQWVNSSHEVAKVLEFQFQHQSFQWTLWTDLL